MIAKKGDPQLSYMIEINHFPLAQRSKLEGNDQIPVGRMSRGINRKGESSNKHASIIVLMQFDIGQRKVAVVLSDLSVFLSWYSWMMLSYQRKHFLICITIAIHIRTACLFIDYVDWAANFSCGYSFSQYIDLNLLAQHKCNDTMDKANLSFYWIVRDEIYVNEWSNQISATSTDTNFNDANSTIASTNTASIVILSTTWFFRWNLSRKEQWTFETKIDRLTYVNSPHHQIGSIREEGNERETRMIRRTTFVDCAISAVLFALYRWTAHPPKLTLIPKQSQENLSPFTKDFCVSEYYNESLWLIFVSSHHAGVLIGLEMKRNSLNKRWLDHHLRYYFSGVLTFEWKDFFHFCMMNRSRNEKNLPGWWSNFNLIKEKEESKETEGRLVVIQSVQIYSCAGLLFGYSFARDEGEKCFVKMVWGEEIRHTTRIIWRASSRRGAFTRGKRRILDFIDFSDFSDSKDYDRIL